MKKLILICLMGSSIAFGQNFEWANRIGGSADDRGNIIKTDASGNIYVGGAFSGTVDFDPGAGTTNLTSVGDLDLFVAKYDASGGLIWATSDGNVFDDLVLDLAVDASGNVFLTGYGEVNTTGSQRAMIAAKLDASGNQSWAHTFTSTSNNVGGYALTIDAAGNAYIAGNFNGTVDFDPSSGSTYELTTTGSINLTDAYILKLDATGNLSWVQQYKCNTANANILGITLDAAGNIYTTGQYWNTMDADPGAGTDNLTHSGNGDMFISKLDMNGAHIWAKKIGSSSSEYGYSIAVDASNNVFTTGYYQGTVDFDPGTGTAELTAEGERDIFVCKLDANGDYVWAKGMGSNNANDGGSQIALDASGNVYTLGYFEGTVDFDPGTGSSSFISHGDKDVYVQKLDNDGNFVWAHQIGDAAADQGLSIYIDAANNIFLTGHFSQSVDFDISANAINLTAAGGLDVFFSKWNQTTIGITETIGNKELYAYPNPTTGALYFSENLEQISIYDLKGQLILLEKQVSSMDVSHLDKGMYVLQMNQHHQTKTQRLVIK